jgi:hypothetical protein
MQTYNSDTYLEAVGTITTNVPAGTEIYGVIKL